MRGKRRWVTAASRNGPPQIAQSRRSATFCGATPIQHAIAQLLLERRRRPSVFRAGRHNVDVVAQTSAGPPSPCPCVAHRFALSIAQALATERAAFQLASDQYHAPGIVRRQWPSPDQFSSTALMQRHFDHPRNAHEFAHSVVSPDRVQARPRRAVPLALGEDGPANPTDVPFLGAQAVIPHRRLAPNLVEQPRLW